MPYSFENKVVLITGGSRGIGAAIARGFAAFGATVIIASRKQAAIDETVAAIRAAGGNACGISCHTGKMREIESLFDTIQTDFGRLDVLVNNAATNPYFGPFLEAGESFFDKTFEVNVKGYFFVAQQASRLMVKQDGGAIINIASTEGVSPSPMMGMYAMTKAAVIMMTKVIARELGGANIRCNCICPGLTETRFAGALIDSPEIHQRCVEQTALGRHAQPEEIVGLALYLASDSASYTTGAVIPCDGGSSI